MLGQWLNEAPSHRETWQCDVRHACPDCPIITVSVLLAIRALANMFRKSKDATGYIYIDTYIYIYIDTFVSSPILLFRTTSSNIIYLCENKCSEIRSKIPLRRGSPTGWNARTFVHLTDRRAAAAFLGGCGIWYLCLKWYTGRDRSRIPTHHRKSPSLYNCFCLLGSF